jgi:hypothetical protein
MSTAAPLIPPARSDADRLNQTCFCITLDRDALCRALERGWRPRILHDLRSVTRTYFPGVEDLQGDFHAILAN